MHKKKIVIRVDASVNMGYGHFYRCLSLAQMLRPAFSISFAMIAPDDFIVDRLANEQFHCLKLTPSSAVRDANETRAELKFDLSNHLEEVAIVIVDGYHFSPSFYRSLREFPLQVAVINDAGTGFLQADLIINQTPGGSRENYQTDNPRPIWALGLRHVLLRAGFLQAARQKIKYKTGLATVLIAFGGSDTHNFTEQIASWLLETSQLSVCAIIGEAYPFKTELEQLRQKYSSRLDIRQGLNEKEMVETLKMADLGIVPTSGICLEAIACRLPLIAGTYVDNQLPNYRNLKAQGIIFDGKKFELPQLQAVINSITVDELREKQNRQIAAIDANSSARLLIKFLYLANQLEPSLRLGTPDDALTYFEWVNEATVRANSFNSEPVEWGNHLKWFNAKMKNDNVLFYLLESHGVALGQVRFVKVDESSWEINYSVDRDFRGMGLGSILIQKGLSNLQQKVNPQIVIAKVKYSNIPSLKVFEKLNFTETESGENVTFKYHY